MGIPLGRAPISTMDLAAYILTTKGDATRRVEKGELKDYLDSLYYCLDTGTANTYVIVPNIPITAYEAGQTYKFKALNANTGASTINISGVGAKSLVKSGNVALVAGDIPKDAIITTIYDGVNFQIVPDFSAQLSEKANKDGTLYYKGYVGSNADLNTFTATGFYHIANATNITNKPTIADWSVLEVLSTGMYIRQIISNSANGLSYIRTRTDSTWSEWKQIATTESIDIPTLLNGWVLFANTVYGTKKIAKTGNLATIDIMVSSSSPNNNAIFILPVGYRPAANLVVPIASYGSTGNVVSLEIFVDGTVHFTGTPPITNQWAHIHVTYQIN